MEGGREGVRMVEMESRHFSYASSTDIVTSPLSQQQEEKTEMELFQVDDHESKTKPRGRGSLRERSLLLQKVIQWC